MMGKCFNLDLIRGVLHMMHSQRLVRVFQFLWRWMVGRIQILDTLRLWGLYLHCWEPMEWSILFQIDNPTANWRSTDPTGNTWTGGQGTGTIDAYLWLDGRSPNTNMFTDKPTNTWTQTILPVPASNRGYFFKVFDKTITLIVTRDSIGNVALDRYTDNIHEFSAKTKDPFAFKNNHDYVPLAIYINNHPLLIYDSSRVLTGSVLLTTLPTSSPTSAPSFSNTYFHLSGDTIASEETA